MIPGGQIRVGQGIDIHRFADGGGRPLVLGGVAIPEGPGLDGHSDADVVLHAVVDALLGAAALGDLGTRFGTDDPTYASAASSVFVTEALRLVCQAGWTVGNLDATIVAQRPRIDSYRPAMTSCLADLLGLAPDAVSVKATTTDGLGTLGRGEGIACTAVVLLHRP
ncbi:MAG: 2-C-methyl-D-erythritol 2,4-cyclodiphosphate synthase [Egibacteraceae bacterium]